MRAHLPSIITYAACVSLYRTVGESRSVWSAASSAAFAHSYAPGCFWHARSPQTKAAEDAALQTLRDVAAVTAPFHERRALAMLDTRLQRDTRVIRGVIPDYLSAARRANGRKVFSQMASDAC